MQYLINKIIKKAKQNSFRLTFALEFTMKIEIGNVILCKDQSKNNYDRSDKSSSVALFYCNKKNAELQFKIVLYLKSKL